MATERLKKLLQKKEQAEKEIRLEQARIKKKERNDDTRRKILTGALVIEEAKKQAGVQKFLDGLRNRDLIRADDRALFGLAPLPDNASAAAPASDGSPAPGVDNQGGAIL